VQQRITLLFVDNPVYVGAALHQKLENAHADPPHLEALVFLEKAKHRNHQRRLIEEVRLVGLGIAIQQ
jgi:hypothetical protein